MRSDALAVARDDAALAAMWRDAIAPETQLAVSEWAEQNRRLSPKVAAEPGPWRNARTPYLREVMDALGVRSPVKVVVFPKGSQVGGTQVGNNWLGYVIDHAPGPCLVIGETLEKAKRNARQQIDPMIAECPRLRARVANRITARRGPDTLLAKEFPGGLLVITGAKSGAALRSMAARYVFEDEIDAWPLSLRHEGEPTQLADRAARTFQRRKIYKVSTPTTKTTSRIWPAWLRTDMRRYHVPCPTCGAMQPIEWAQLRWAEDTPREVRLQCVACSALIPEGAKTEMLARGAWRATRQSDDPTTVGFHLSALYSPVGWFSWAEAVAMYRKARDEDDPEQMRIFVNTVLGEPYEDSLEVPDWNALYHHRETYRLGIAPEGVLFVTAGADVQADRLEVLVVGWGVQRGAWVAWIVDRIVLEGDTGRDDVWCALDELLATPVPAEVGPPMPLRVLAIDSGYETRRVYKWAARHPRPAWGPAGGAAPAPRTVAVTKGVAHAIDLVSTAARVTAAQKKRAVPVFTIGTNVAKEELYTSLRLVLAPREPTAEPPPQLIHFADGLESDFFKQLTAERPVVHLRRGAPIIEWEVQAGRRNEMTDCWVGARAAAHLYGIDRFGAVHWKLLRRGRQSGCQETPRAPVDRGETPPAVVAEETPTARPRRRRRRLPPGRRWIDR